MGFVKVGIENLTETIINKFRIYSITDKDVAENIL